MPAKPVQREDLPEGCPEVPQLHVCRSEGLSFKMPVRQTLFSEIHGTLVQLEVKTGADVLFDIQ